MPAYRVYMQVTCRADQVEAVAEYLQGIPGWYATAPLYRPDNEEEPAYIQFGLWVREEVDEEAIWHTAEERVSQYLRQRPDFRPVSVGMIAVTGREET